MTDDRIKRIEKRLTETLQPTELVIKDQSHLHAGHAGAQDGKGHFDVRIVSDQFSGQSLMKRHRDVYAALGDLMETDIHALKIRAKAPDEG